MTESVTATGGGRRKGRRPAGEDTRAALLEAARQVFVEQGYDGATVRSIAAIAGVDAAMVNHWFGGKEALFAAAMRIPVDPTALVDELLGPGPDGLGERIVRRFLGVWDATSGGALIAMLRSVSSHEPAARMMREFITRVLFGRLVALLGADRPELRAALCGSQIVGLAMVRYVIRLEPLASADVDTVAAAVGPNLQRYLTGPL
ncbi:MAG TPA: TetR family transcriptional regulator [Pseudonocardiaceae bacterium]